MEKIDIQDTRAVAIGDASVRRALSEAGAITGLSINQYRIAPDEGLPAGLHAHMDQEEIFLVTKGTLTFETLEGPVVVSESELIRFAPGEYQSGKNESEIVAEVLAIGAPRETTDIRIPVQCPACGSDSVRLDFDGERVTFVCPTCEDEQKPADCPACGCSDLRVTIDAESDPVVICTGCNAEFETPPLQD